MDVLLVDARHFLAPLDLLIGPTKRKDFNLDRRFVTADDKSHLDTNARSIFDAVATERDGMNLNLLRWRSDHLRLVRRYACMSITLKKVVRTLPESCWQQFRVRCLTTARDFYCVIGELNNCEEQPRGGPRCA